MKRLLAKLGFIHRLLWQRDAGYRAAVLLGPAPLVGAGLACGLWAGALALKDVAYQPPNWAVAPKNEIWRSDANQPQVLQPAKPLPEAGSNGALVGHETGWNVVASPIQVSQTMDVDVKPSQLARFTIREPSVDMGQILAGGPKTSLFVGIGTGFFVVRQPGVYAFSLRFERPPSSVADCLTRLGFGPHRIVSYLSLNVGETSRNYRVAWFDLRPGLYPIGWAFGCWHDNEVIGPGRIIILVGHPGETNLLPARPDDFVR